MTFSMNARCKMKLGNVLLYDVHNTLPIWSCGFEVFRGTEANLEVTQHVIAFPESQFLKGC
jgi:hypothetical protein